MTLKSNKTIESELIQRAVDEDWANLLQQYPDIRLQPNLELLKNIHGYGFIAGIYHGTTRVDKLCSA